MNLLVKPKKSSQEIVSVTPQSAGWRYVSFSAYRLALGESLTLSDDANELCAVILSGMASAKSGAIEWKEIGERKSVFEDSAPYAVYVPPRTNLTITARTDLELAVAGAPAKGELPPRLIEPSAIRRSARGKGANTRYVCDILPQDQPLSPYLLWRSRPQAETPLAIRRTNTMWITFRPRVCLKKPIIIVSTRPKALFSNVSIPTRATLMSRWPSKIGTSSLCLVATIRS